MALQYCSRPVLRRLRCALGESAVTPIAIAGGVLLALFLAIAWLLLHRLARPLDRLALDVGIIARENPDHRLNSSRVTGWGE